MDLVSRLSRRSASLLWLFSLCAAQAGALLVFLNFAGALPLVQRDLGLSNTQAGVIQSGGQLGYLLAVLVLSSLSDYVAGEFLVIGGALWAGLANLAFAFWARDVPTAVGLRALIGLGVAGIYMPGVRLLSQRFPPSQRGRVIGVFVASFTVGTAASIALGGGLAARMGWQWAFALTSLGAFAGGLIAFLARPLAPQAQPKASQSERARPFSELLRNRPAQLAILAYTAHTWVLFGLRSWLPAFLAATLVLFGNSLARATQQGSAIVGIATLLAAGGTAAAAAFSDRLGRTPTLIAITSLTTLSLLGLGLSLAFPWELTVALSILAAVAANSDSAVISTSLTEAVPDDYLGRALAVYSFSGFTAGTIAPLVFGAVLDYTGPPTLSNSMQVISPWFWGFASLGLVSLFDVRIAVALHRRLLHAGEVEIA